MYDELVKRLRMRANLYKKINQMENCIMDEAADAIEELSRQLDSMNDANISLYGALPKWISVKERLPDMADMVLVCSENGLAVDTAWRTQFSIPSGAWDSYSGEFNPESITHWMPLRSRRRRNEHECSD